jgi:hypothetical protein
MENRSPKPDSPDPVTAPRDLDKHLVASSVFEDAVELAAELEVLLSRFAPSREPGALLDMAEVLEAYAGAFEIGGDRLRLWAALLRQRVSGARPTTVQALPRPRLVAINTEP